MISHVNHQAIFNLLNWTKTQLLVILNSAVAQINLFVEEALGLLIFIISKIIMSYDAVQLLKACQFYRCD